MKKAIYAGSFDPFTKGHLEIIKQATKIFDFIYVVIANNPKKKRRYHLSSMRVEIMETLIENDIQIDKVKVYQTEELISDYAKKRDVEFLIRGLRNNNDYNYEENIAKINKELNPNLKTVYLRSNNEIISSTFVKTIFDYGKDISKYVSPQILKLMENEK